MQLSNMDQSTYKTVVRHSMITIVNEKAILLNKRIDSYKMTSGVGYTA